jgi:hypothetical protein
MIPFSRDSERIVGRVEDAAGPCEREAQEAAEAVLKMFDWCLRQIGQPERPHDTALMGSKR